MRYFFLIALLSSALAVVVLADPGRPLARPDAPAATQPTTRPVNRMCLVEPEQEIDLRATLEHQGKLLGFCCKDCLREFRRNPEKYLK